MRLDFSKLGPEFDIQWYIDEGYGSPFDIVPDTSHKLIINACLTGMVPRKKDTPYVPITAEEIIADAVRCYEAGASIVHLHARDRDGDPTYRKEVYRDLVIAIRQQCPDVIVSLTTSGRNWSELEKRSQVLELEGEAKPDLASLTTGSMNFPDQANINPPGIICALAEKMTANGIKPEIEIFETGMINYALYLRKHEILRGPMYFNLLLGVLGAMPARIKDLNHLLDTLPDGCIWSATGIGRFQLPINMASILLGSHVRVGLEDNIWFDAARTRLATNAQLVKRVADFARFVGRAVATAKEAREMLKLP